MDKASPVTVRYNAPQRRRWRSILVISIHVRFGIYSLPSLRPLSSMFHPIPSPADEINSTLTEEELVVSVKCSLSARSPSSLSTFRQPFVNFCEPFVNFGRRTRARTPAVFSTHSSHFTLIRISIYQVQRRLWRRYASDSGCMPPLCRLCNKRLLHPNSTCTCWLSLATANNAPLPRHCASRSPRRTIHRKL